MRPGAPCECWKEGRSSSRGASPGGHETPGGKKLACLSARSMPIWDANPNARADELMITNRRNTSAVVAVLVSGVLVLSVSADGFRLADQDAFAPRGAKPLSPPRIMHRPFITTRPASPSSKVSISAAACTESTSTPPSLRRRLQYQHVSHRQPVGRGASGLRHVHAQGLAGELWIGRLFALRREHNLAAGYGFSLGRY